MLWQLYVMSDEWTSKLMSTNVKMRKKGKLNEKKTVITYSVHGDERVAQKKRHEGYDV